MKSRNPAILFPVTLIIMICCATLWSGRGEGQEKRYPTRPIEVIVNMQPGGPVDQAARIIVNELTKELGVTISIQYKAGAGGMVGAAHVSTAEPDGYTLLTTGPGPMIGSPVVEKNCPYDPLKGFTPIVYFGNSPNVILTHATSKLAAFEALVKFAKEKPGALTANTSGVGTTSHFVIEVMKMYGVEITHVPAKGAAPSLANLLGKHVDLAIILYPPAVPHLRSGEIKMLAVTNKIAREPQVPTLTEKGFPEAEILGAWQGFLAPPNLPKPIIDRLTGSLRKVIQTPSVVATLENAGFTVEYLGPEEFKKKIERDLQVMEKVAKAAGLAK